MPESPDRRFRPDYLSFAGTYRCNLTCPHCCVPIEWPDRLDIPAALRFLEDARREGIRTLGFTGGEPFLYPEFVLAVTRRAADLGFAFDKVMTNGVWFVDEAELERVVVGLRDAGFTGKVGLSVDKFHGIHTAKLATFCRSVRRVFDRDTVLSLSYASRSPDQGLDPIRKLAAELDAVIDWSPLLRRYLLVAPDFTMTLNWNHLATVERAEGLPGDPWDGEWFEEDFCEGPGQALIVNPRGDVKPCCGFASDLDQLTIGNIHTDTAGEVIERGRNHPYVGKVFREGLTAIRAEVLARDPAALPGATSNHCYFCWYVLVKNLVSVPAAAGGTPQGRMSLPLVGGQPQAEPDERGRMMVLLMRFDGKTVFVGTDLPPKGPHDKGEVFGVKIVGPAAVGPPKNQMGWEEYQGWIDGLRGAGYTLTTHRIEAGCGSCR